MIIFNIANTWLVQFILSYFRNFGKIQYFTNIFQLKEQDLNEKKGSHLEQNMDLIMLVLIVEQFETKK